MTYESPDRRVLARLIGFLAYRQVIVVVFGWQNPSFSRQLCCASLSVSITWLYETL